MTRAVPQADEIRNILEQGLAKSEVVVLLQTEGCLTRPWVKFRDGTPARRNCAREAAQGDGRAGFFAYGARI